MVNSVQVLLSLVSIGALWCLHFWLYCPYRLDLTRDRLFCIRDGLFDLGRQGVVPFDHAAYGMLRSIINGTIRHAHRMSLMGFAMHLVFVQRDELFRRCSEDFGSDWRSAVDSLPPAARQHVLELRAQVHYVILDQIVYTSPLLLCMLVPAVLCFFLGKQGERAFERVRCVVGHRLVDNLARQMDCSAVVDDPMGGLGPRASHGTAT